MEAQDQVVEEEVASDEEVGIWNNKCFNKEREQTTWLQHFNYQVVYLKGNLLHGKQ